MGRGATVASGNVWYEARIRASKNNPKLASREGAAEALNMSVSAVQDAELDITKHMPVDKAVLMADVYNAPELVNYYCLHECPIGCKRSISDDRIDIERATVQLTKILRKDVVQGVKHRLQDIAEDGKVSEDEVEALDEVLEDLKELSKIISKLETIRASIR